MDSSPWLAVQDRSSNFDHSPWWAPLGEFGASQAKWSLTNSGASVWLTFPNQKQHVWWKSTTQFPAFPPKNRNHFFGKVAPFFQTHQKIIITLFPRKINQPTWQPKRHRTWIFQTVDYMVPLQGVNSSYLRGFHWNPVWSRWRVLEDLPRNCHRAWRVLQVLHLDGVRPKIWRKKVSIQSGPRQK